MAAGIGRDAPVSVASATAVLFSRVTARLAERVVVPINESAMDVGTQGPAFYCVHSASGVAGTDFLDLAERLEAGSIQLFGIQAPPNRFTDPTFGTSVEALADYYTEALDRFQPEGPIALGGYCVGAVLALAMAERLTARGRVVGPLIAIDGVPENTGVKPRRLGLRYCTDMLRNIPGWLSHADLMRRMTLKQFVWSVSNNTRALSKRLMGLKRGERRGGGYTIEGIMDLSLYQPAHKDFINRLFNALFMYRPTPYPGEVVVYEARTQPLLYQPQIGRTWRKFSPHAQIVSVQGTHISILSEPYVELLALDLQRRLADFFRLNSAKY